MNHNIIQRTTINIISHYLYDIPIVYHGNQQEHTHAQINNKSNVLKPLDLFLRTYFNSHKHLGSSERSAIADKVYNMVRYEYLLSHIIRSRPFDLSRRIAYSAQIQQ